STSRLRWQRVGCLDMQEPQCQHHAARTRTSRARVNGGWGCRTATSNAVVSCGGMDKSMPPDKRFCGWTMDTRVSWSKRQKLREIWNVHGGACNLRQGGSDVRANTTTATPLPGGDDYVLRGHK